jgi:hypothetical protein
MSETKSVLPAETAGTEVTRFNALRHGVLSRYTVLPWENSDEYRAVVEALVAEHVPRGPTEEHLVEEIAGIVWRKRRLRLAEAAAHRRGLEDTLEPYRKTAKAALVHLDVSDESESASDAVRATAADTDEDMVDMEGDEAMTRRALDLLGSRRNDAYEAALAVLREDTKDWWADVLARDPDDIEEGEKPATADVDGADSTRLTHCGRRQQINFALRNSLLDHRVRRGQHGFRDSEAEGLGRFEVDDELVFHRKLHREIARLRAA